MSAVSNAMRAIFTVGLVGSTLTAVAYVSLKALGSSTGWWGDLSAQQITDRVTAIQDDLTSINAVPPDETPRSQLERVAQSMRGLLEQVSTNRTSTCAELHQLTEVSRDLIDLLRRQLTRTGVDRITDPCRAGSHPVSVVISEVIEELQRVMGESQRELASVARASREARILADSIRGSLQHLRDCQAGLAPEQLREFLTNVARELRDMVANHDRE